MSDMQTMAKAALVAERRKHERELTALRQQVADLRAALQTCDEAARNIHVSAAGVVRIVTEQAERVLAATQPQEVQP